MCKKCFDQAEVKIIFLSAESVIVTSVTVDGNDGKEDNPEGWLNFS